MDTTAGVRSMPWTSEDAALFGWFCGCQFLTKDRKLVA